MALSLYSLSMITRYGLALDPLLSSAFAQSQPQPVESEVKNALASFIRAFDDLDWEGFRLAFDDNATVFYPRAVPERANGRAEFEKTFRPSSSKFAAAKPQPHTWTFSRKK
jgi:hypothetical protein